MKTTLFTLILFFSAIIAGAQSLMLTCSKAEVKAEMNHYPEWMLTVAATNYLEYQKDSTAISYRFQRTGKLSPWLCDQAAITLPAGEEINFISQKTGCNCWKPTGPDEWLYQTNVFDRLVKVRRYRNPGSVTFVYCFR